MKKKIAVLFMVIICGILFTGCQNRSSQENRKMVVASFYPVYIFTWNVIQGAENMDLSMIAAPQAGCLHDYQLTVGDMEKLNGADLLIINGAGMESFLERAVNTYPDLTVADSSLGADILEEEEGEEDHAGHDHEHDHGQANSHIWLSPRNAMVQVENIKEALCRLDPQQAELFEKNAAAYQQKLEKIALELESFGERNHDSAASFHEAFSYLAQSCGLEIAVSIPLDELASPSASQLAQGADRIKEEEVFAVFAADDGQKKVAETVAEEADVPIYVLDPFVNGPLELDAYEKAMAYNQTVLKEAMS